MPTAKALLAIKQTHDAIAKLKNPLSKLGTYARRTPEMLSAGIKQTQALLVALEAEQVVDNST